MFLKILNGVIQRLAFTPHKTRYFYYSYGNPSYKIEPGMKFFSGDGTMVYGEGQFTVEGQSYCGSRCGFQLSKGHSISIGKRTAISHNVRIYTGNRNPLDIITAENRVEGVYGDVNIGSDCWVGANVFINQGVTIGDNVVIGANSVVSKDIPSNSIAVGAPIKVIKTHNMICEQ